MADLQDSHLFQEAVRLYRDGQLAAADAAGRKIHEADRKNAEVLSLLGHIAFRRNLFDDALSWFRKCATLQPKAAVAYVYLGNTLVHLGRHREALDRFDKALRLDPSGLDAKAGKADLLLVRGQYDKARVLVAPEVQSGRGGVEMAVILSELELESGNPEAAITAGAAWLERADVPDGVRYRLGSVIGRAYERMGSYDEAFAAYEAGNRDMPPGFDPVRYTDGITSVIEAFSADRLAALPRAAVDSELPVFVVGMPRSGSTLVERILDAHPDVHGAGEIGLVYEQVQSMGLAIGSSLGYPDCVRDLEQADVDRLGREHLDALKKLNRQAKRIVDKNLVNALHLGLISLLLPKAKIIHCRRDPLDTCLSCFAIALQPAVHPWTTDLRHIGLAYRQYARVMDHWREVLDVPMLEIDYETIVADQETASRQIIEFCGLDWDDKCLRFHETRRHDKTLSYGQVRKPVYKSSVKRAERFEKHLGPLRETLGDLLPGGPERRGDA